MGIASKNFGFSGSLEIRKLEQRFTTMAIANAFRLGIFSNLNVLKTVRR